MQGVVTLSAETRGWRMEGDLSLDIREVQPTTRVKEQGGSMC